MHRLKQSWRLLKKLVHQNVEAVTSYRERRVYQRKAPDYWQQLPTAVFEEHEPVFVLSTGRCGTALLTEILRQAPGVLCFHSPSPELVYYDRRAYEEGLEKFECYQTAIAVARFELVADCTVRGRRYVETNRRITFFAPHLAQLFPHARFIHLVRHPGDFVRSGVRRGYYQGSYDDLSRIAPRSGEARDAWPNMDPFEQCAWLWNETNAFIESAKQNMDGCRVLTVQAEDLFNDPGTSARIFAHCGLDCPPRHQMASRITRPVNAEEYGPHVPRHDQWDEGRRDRIRRWVPLAGLYGYEL